MTKLVPVGTEERPTLPLRQVPLEVLRCPLCRSAFDREAESLQCVGCSRRFAQSAQGWVDLLPAEIWNPVRAGWAERQSAMEAGYRDLVADPAHTVLAYNSDFGPYRDLLLWRTGRLLDLGGGNGLLRHFLPEGIEYIVAEPNLWWLSEAWQPFAGAFPCLGIPLAFVRAVGEALPFADGAFDHVVSFWSLNHTADPEAVVNAAHRVLRPGGHLLLALEDVPPRWRDVLAGAYIDPRCPGRLQQCWWKVKAVGRGWPLQEDHVRIEERDIRRWSRLRFDIFFRGWVGAYLTFDLRKRDGSE
jgi:SAM-dependent methyltransferase